jgi:hypothetical protein
VTAPAAAKVAPKPKPKPKPSVQPVDAGTAGDAPKPSRTKSATAGAATGAVGGPTGAAVGAATGFLTGGGGRKGRGSNKPLVAEFTICMAVLVLTPMVNNGADITVAKFMKKASATAAVFIILGFISAIGDAPRKAAQGIGFLMTLTILINERSVFGQVVKAVSGEGKPTTPARPESNPAAPLPTNNGNTPLPSTTSAPAIDYSDPFSLGATLGENVRSAATNGINRWEADLEARPGRSVAAKAWDEFLDLFR